MKVQRPSISNRPRLRGFAAAAVFLTFGGQTLAQSADAIQGACLRKGQAIDQSNPSPVEKACRYLALYEGECANAPGAANEVTRWRDFAKQLGATSCSNLPSPALSRQPQPPSNNSNNRTTPVRSGGWGASHCLSLGKVWSGGISTESAILKNSCNEKVNYTYCVDSGGDGVVSCRKQKFGAGSVRANGEDAITVMGENRPMHVYWNACFDGGQSIWPLDKRFTGNEVVAQCRPLMGK